MKIWILDSEKQLKSEIQLREIDPEGGLGGCVPFVRIEWREERAVMSLGEK